MLSEFWTRELGGGSLQAALARFVAWYRDEFLSLFPRETAAWLVDRGDRELVLRPGDREVWLVDGRGARMSAISLDEIAASTLDEAIRRRGLAPKTVKLGLEIPPQAFFVRRFDIPAAAALNLPRLIIADIERKTPFRLADVVYGYKSERHAQNPDKLGVELWILRRDIVTRAIEASGVAMDDVAFVRPTYAAGSAAPPTIMLQGASEASHLFRYIVIGLVAATALLAITGVALTLMRQNELNEELDAKIQAMSARAAKVRKIADGAASASRLLAVLRDARVKGPLFADLWEETSRILPDGAYVTDFRLVEPRTDQRAIEIVGFATSAVGLPALFSKSTMFNDAELTAPITPDEQQKKEGFSLRAQIAEKNKAGK